MKKIIRKNLGIKLLGAVNCLALCLTAYTANLACNWLYYQEDEPEEVKKMRKFSCGKKWRAGFLNYKAGMGFLKRKTAGCMNMLTAYCWAGW